MQAHAHHVSALLHRMLCWQALAQSAQINCIRLASLSSLVWPPPMPSAAASLPCPCSDAAVRQLAEAAGVEVLSPVSHTLYVRYSKGSGRLCWGLRPPWGLLRCLQ